MAETWSDEPPVCNIANYIQSKIRFGVEEEEEEEEGEEKDLI